MHLTDRHSASGFFEGSLKTSLCKIMSIVIQSTALPLPLIVLFRPKARQQVGPGRPVMNSIWRAHGLGDAAERGAWSHNGTGIHYTTL